MVGITKTETVLMAEYNGTTDQKIHSITAEQKLIQANAYYKTISLKLFILFPQTHFMVQLLESFPAP